MSDTCPACGGAQWDPLLELPGRPSLTTDLRRADRSLHKVLCANCGLAANAIRRGTEAIVDYEDHYALNTTGGEEHYYYTAEGPVARSAAILSWLLRHIPTPPERLVEVGCGQGNLLVRLRDALPETAVRGVEINRQAALLAEERGLVVDRIAVATDAAPLPSADCLISFGVLEHVDDPALFLSALRRSCSPGGRAIIAFPIQQSGCYDLFFEDHVWHFTLDQARAIAERAGWRVVSADANHPIVQGFGTLVCVPDDPRHSAPVSASETRRLHAANRDTWLAAFAEVDRRLEDLGATSIMVFGAGELFGLLHTYTSLGHRRISCLIDDSTDRQGRELYGIPVEGRDALTRRRDQPLFVAVNRRYHGDLAESLCSTSAHVVFWC